MTSGRDLGITEQSVPRDLSKWISIPVATSNIGGSSAITSTLNIWMPKDRAFVNKIVDVYFNHLNIHRPVFFRSDFDRKLKALYDRENIQYDPGYICSMYLILALGTLSELNHQGSLLDKDKKMPSDSPINTKKLLPAIWPEHDEFFERALAVKPHLRVTISSLQALILLQWYLYTEVCFFVFLWPFLIWSPVPSDKVALFGAWSGVLSVFQSNSVCTMTPQRSQILSQMKSVSYASGFGVTSWCMTEALPSFSDVHLPLLPMTPIRLIPHTD